MRTTYLAYFLVVVPNGWAQKSSLFCADDYWAIKSVNWFHLQGLTSFGSQLTSIGRNWDDAVTETLKIFPDSKFGAAFYESPTMPYELLSLLTNEEAELAHIRKAFLRSTTPSEDLPDQELGISDDYKGYEPDDKYPMRAPFEPVVWTALHANWNVSRNVYRVITLFDRLTPARAGVPDTWDLQKYGPFTVDTYPSTTPQFWPDPKKQPRLSSESDFVKLSLVKSVLWDQQIKLVIAYGVFREISTRQEWSTAAREIGRIFNNVALTFVPGHFAKGGNELRDTFLTEMQAQSDCIWIKPTVPCETEPKINWFHLQERRGWASAMKGVTAAWEKAAITIMTAYSKAKFGAAFFSDATDKHYQMLANLYGGTSQRLFIAAFMTLDIQDSSAIPMAANDEAAAKPADYDTREDEMLPTAPMEPIIWTAIHLNWESGAEVIRMISLNTASLPHHADDPSKDDINQKKFDPFTLDTYPVDTPGIWPDPSKQPRLSTNSQYAPLSLVKKALKDNNVHLVVNYARSATYTAEKTWIEVLESLDVDPQKYFYRVYYSSIPTDFGAGFAHMDRNIVKAISTFTECSTTATTTTTTTTTPTTTPTTTTTTPTTTPTTTLPTTTTPTTTTTTTPTTTTTTPTTTPTTTTTTPTTTTTATTPTTTTPTTTPTTTTSTTTSATTTKTTPTTTTTRMLTATTTPAASTRTPTTTTTEPGTTSTRTKAASTTSEVSTSSGASDSTDNGCNDPCDDSDENCKGRCKCPGMGCWNGEGLMLVVDEKPKSLDMKIVM